MKVVLQSHFFANGVMYRKGIDGAAVDIPRSLEGKLPKTARVLKPGERLSPKEDMPYDSRAKPGSGDPNLTEVDEVFERVEADKVAIDPPAPKHPNQELHDADPGRAAAKATQALLDAVEKADKKAKAKK